MALRLRKLFSVVGAIGLVAAGCAPALTSPPQLIAAWPTDGASLPVGPTTLELTFNRALSPESSWADAWREDDGASIPVQASVDEANRLRLTVRLMQPSAGRYRVHWHVVSTQAGAALDGEQAFLMQNESTSPPHLDVSPLRVEAGDNLQVTGSGFGPKCNVQLTVGDDEQALTHVDTDARGSFSVEARVPATEVFGEQPVSATDACGSAAKGAVQVRWGGWPPLVGFDVGQPGPGSGEVTFSVALRNRSDYLLERVRVILTDPAGATFRRAEPSPVRQDQAVVWEMPSVDRGVVGPFVATYHVGGAVVSHATIQFRHRKARGCTGDECLPAFLSETTSDSTPTPPAD